MAASITLLAAIHLQWLERFRVGYPTGWDESGYMATAMNNASVLTTNGPIALVRTVMLQGYAGPAVPLATVPFYLLFGKSIETSLVVLLVFLLCLAAASYLLASQLMPRPFAAISALTVATAPVVADYSRIYHFAVPAAVFFTLALWAAVRSEGFSDRAWTIAMGFLIGLVLLTRTMTIAFLPTIAAIAVIDLAWSGENRKRRLTNLFLGLAATVVVAGPWWLWNLQQISGYLGGAGYGSSSAIYGPSYPVTSIDFWLREARIVANYLYLPLAVLVAVSLLLGIALRVRTLSPVWRSWTVTYNQANRAALVLFIVVGEGYAALTSSPNEGTAFALPWLPALIILAVALVATLTLPRLRIAMAAVFVALCAVNMLMKSGLAPPLFTTLRVIELPVLDRVVLTDGRGLIEQDIENAGYPVNSPGEPLPSLQRAWLPLYRDVAEAAISYSVLHRQTVTLLFGSDDQIFNNTRVQLAAELWFDRHIDVGILSPFVGGDSVGSYREQLEQRRATFVVTAERAPVEDWPISRQSVEAAARSIGFEVVETFTLPDGRHAWLWARRSQP